MFSGILLLGMFWTGCSGMPEQQASYPDISDQDGVRLIQNGPLEHQACAVSPAPVVSIGVAEGEDPYQLYRVMGAAKLSDGTIVLVNQGTQQIRFYDPEGRFLRAAGTEGDGPGEFRSAFYLRVLRGDSIWVGDYRPWEFEIFSPTGSWSRNVRPFPEWSNNPSGWGILDDGRFILGKRDPLDREKQWSIRSRHVLSYDVRGAFEDTLMVLEDGRWGILSPESNFWASPLFESFAQFDARSNVMVSGHGSETGFSVWRFTPGAVLEERIQWMEHDRAVTEEDIETARQSIIDRNAGLEPDMYRMFVEPQINGERPVADVRPAFSDINISVDDSYWVKFESGQTEPDIQRWGRFLKEGTYGCTLTLPARLDVVEFGSDYVLARDRDDVGVERIVEYQLEL